MPEITITQGDIDEVNRGSISHKILIEEVCCRFAERNNLNREDVILVGKWKDSWAQHYFPQWKGAQD